EIHSAPVAGVPPALADPSLLMAAILNLAILARDAMPEGGKLGFEAGRADREASDFVVITVSACGHDDIPDQPVPAFADLGAIEDFVRQSGGHLAVSGEAGRGTSVRIYLPRATGAVRSSPGATDSCRARSVTPVIPRTAGPKGFSDR
ncbi:MAG: hypothetical protein Q8K88_02955, partial [Bradyrhizobium sp.]|nr:hypothetical protein [Bradyrhizobium sp.]